jgi:hypothetical protein
VYAAEISIHWKRDSLEREKIFSRTLQRHSAEPSNEQRSPCRIYPEGLLKNHVKNSSRAFLCRPTKSAAITSGIPIPITPSYPLSEVIALELAGA